MDAEAEVFAMILEDLPDELSVNTLMNVPTLSLAHVGGLLQDALKRSSQSTVNPPSLIRDALTERQGQETGAPKLRTPCVLADTPLNHATTEAPTA